MQLPTHLQYTSLGADLRSRALREAATGVVAPWLPGRLLVHADVTLR